MWCADRDALYVATTACLLLPDAGEGAVHGGAIMRDAHSAYLLWESAGSQKKVRIVGVISMLLGRDEIFGLADSDELVVPDDDRLCLSDDRCSELDTCPTVSFSLATGHTAMVELPSFESKKMVACALRPGKVQGIECNMDPKTGLRQVVWDAPSWCGPSGRILYYHVEMVTMDTCRSRRCAGTEVCLDKDVIAIKIRAADRDEILGASTAFVVP